MKSYNRTLADGLLVVAVIWSTALIAAPAAVANLPSADPLAMAGGVTYLVGSVVCHQQATRSFTWGGVTLPVCGRCTGLYFGGGIAAIGLLVRRRHRPRRLHVVRAAVIVAALPTVATLAAELIVGIDPGNLGRAVAGAPLGSTVVWGAAVALRAEPATEWGH